MNSYIPLTHGDLLLASIFLVMNALFSIILSLGLQRQLIISALRMVTQLFLVRLVLKTIFALSSPWLTLLVAAIMVAFAGREIWARQHRHLRGVWGIGLGSTSMLLAGTIVTVFALTTQLQPTPWWSPQFALPLFGMILGNTMTGVSLGLDTLHTALHRERAAIEARLLLGSTRWQAVPRHTDTPSVAASRRSSTPWRRPVSSLYRA
jgi:putative ABC transport system permease protein